jgi:hypothetical protein
MKRSVREAAKGTILGLSTAAALTAGGDHRPLVTEAEKVEAVKIDQQALLRHIGTCGITKVEDVSNPDPSKKLADDEGNPRASLKVHVVSEETAAAKQARIREKFLDGLYETSMDVSAFARDPSNPNVPNYGASVNTDFQSFNADEPLNDDVDVYPIQPGTKKFPGHVKIVDIFMEDTVNVAPEYKKLGVKDGDSREYCGTIQGTLDPKTGKTEWKPFAAPPIEDAVFIDGKLQK